MKETTNSRGTVSSYLLYKQSNIFMYMVKFINSKKRNVIILLSAYSISFVKIVEFIDNLILTVTHTKLNDDL